MFQRLRLLTGASTELAQPQMAVRDEWAHAQLGGQPHGPTILGLGLLDFPTIGMRGDLSEKPAGSRFESTFPAFAGQLSGAFGEPHCVLASPGEQVTVAEVDHHTRLA